METEDEQVERDQQQDQEEGSVGPPEDIENDPAYNPDEEHLKDLKGG